ncbi:MAG: hypothetical protein B6244_02845 [Candidatus Cloacimonetes bacterium 4572_55]|nr:MAG: hypothetical protein B6244_02845 [Candidatus Cloacimonetes bacterium 4572_55]
MSKVYYSSMRERPLEMEEERTPQSGVAVYGYLILLFSIAILLITYIWEYHQVMDISDQIRQSGIQTTRLQEMNHTMIVEIAGLSTRSRVQRMASQGSNLAYPQPEYVIWSQNSRDRFRDFDNKSGSFLAGAGDWLTQFLSTRSVEANSENK